MVDYGYEHDVDANHWLPYADECYANAAQHLPRLLEGIREGAEKKDWNRFVDAHHSWYHGKGCQSWSCRGQILQIVANFRGPISIAAALTWMKVHVIRLHMGMQLTTGG